MRIGLFTDTYRPSVNGIVYVIDITRKHLEAEGHEVFIFCPGSGVSRKALQEDNDDHVIRFPSVKGAFFDDYSLSLFFPTRELKRIKELELDVIMFFTPSQVGLMGVYAAQRTGAVLVAQHSTDLAQFIHHYPAVTPGLLMLAMTLPLTFRFHGKDVRELMQASRPRRSLGAWGQEMIESLVAMIYSRCDAVISLSRKSQKQLCSWRDEEYTYDVKIIPTGIDALPIASKEQIAAFKSKYDIAPSDKVVMYVGRLSSEKNLDILIDAMEHVLTTHPDARLVYVGDFEYRQNLEEHARSSGYGDRITFTGALPRESLGCAYGSADIFAFPSLTDTQGLVLHEAAHAGLPIVLIDKNVTEVVRDGENGLVARNSPKSIARSIVTLFNDPDLCIQYGKRSKELATAYDEKSQVDKLIELFEQAVRRSKRKQNT